MRKNKNLIAGKRKFGLLFVFLFLFNFINYSNAYNISISTLLPYHVITDNSQYTLDDYETNVFDDLKARDSQFIFNENDLDYNAIDCTKNLTNYNRYNNVINFGNTFTPDYSALYSYNTTATKISNHKNHLNCLEQYNSSKFVIDFEENDIGSVSFYFCPEYMSYAGIYITLSYSTPYYYDFLCNINSNKDFFIFDSAFNPIDSFDFEEYWNVWSLIEIQYNCISNEYVVLLNNQPIMYSEQSFYDNSAVEYFTVLSDDSGIVNAFYDSICINSNYNEVNSSSFESEIITDLEYNESIYALEMQNSTTLQFNTSNYDNDYNFELNSVLQLDNDTLFTIEIENETNSQLLMIENDISYCNNSNVEVFHSYVRDSDLITSLSTTWDYDIIDFSNRLNVFYVNPITFTTAITSNKFTSITEGSYSYYIYLEQTNKLILSALYGSGYKEAMHIGFNSAGNIYAYNGNTSTFLQTYTSDNWYFIEVKFDCNNLTYSVYIDNVLKANSFQFRNNVSLISLNNLFYSSTIETSFAVDDISYSWINSKFTSLDDFEYEFDVDNFDLILYLYDLAYYGGSVKVEQYAKYKFVCRNGIVKLYFNSNNSIWYYASTYDPIDIGVEAYTFEFQMGLDYTIDCNGEEFVLLSSYINITAIDFVFYQDFNSSELLNLDIQFNSTNILYNLSGNEYIVNNTFIDDFSISFNFYSNEINYIYAFDCNHKLYKNSTLECNFNNTNYQKTIQNIVFINQISYSSFDFIEQYFTQSDPLEDPSNFYYEYTYTFGNNSNSIKANYRMPCIHYDVSEEYIYDIFNLNVESNFVQNNFTLMLGFSFVNKIAFYIDFTTYEFKINIVDNHIYLYYKQEGGSYIELFDIFDSNYVENDFVYFSLFRYNKALTSYSNYLGYAISVNALTYIDMLYFNSHVLFEPIISYVNTYNFPMGLVVDDFEIIAMECIEGCERFSNYYPLLIYNSIDENIFDYNWFYANSLYQIDVFYLQTSFVYEIEYELSETLEQYLIDNDIEIQYFTISNVWFNITNQNENDMYMVNISHIISGSNDSFTYSENELSGNIYTGGGFPIDFEFEGQSFTDFFRYSQSSDFELEFNSTRIIINYDDNFYIEYYLLVVFTIYVMPEGSSITQIGLNSIAPLLLLSIFPFVFFKIMKKKGIPIGLILGFVILTLSNFISLTHALILIMFSIAFAILMFKKEKISEGVIDD